MEPEVTICRSRNENRRGGCCNIVNLFVLIVLLAIVLGIIVGAVFSETILANLAAIIVLAIVLGILTILQAMKVLCKRERIC